MQNIRGKTKSMRGRNKDGHVQSFQKSNLQNYQNNQDLGIFKKEDTSYLISRYILGNEAEFLLSDNSRCLGLIKAISPQAEFGVIYSRSKEANAKEFSDTVTPDAKLINYKDVKKIVIRNVNPNECLKANFTDGDIARQSGKQIEHKDLVPFFQNEQCLEDESLDMCTDTFSPQEMYQVNEEIYNVVSSYDPELSQYTVPVDKNDPNYPKLEEICERMAKEFNNDSDEAHLANADNEEYICAVKRTNDTPHSKPERSRGNQNNYDKKSQRHNNSSSSYNNNKSLHHQNKNNLTFMDNSIKSASKLSTQSPSKNLQAVSEKSESQPSSEATKNNSSEANNSDSKKTGDDSTASVEKKMVELDLDAPPFEPTPVDPPFVSMPQYYMPNQICMVTQQPPMQMPQPPMIPPSSVPHPRASNYNIPGQSYNYGHMVNPMQIMPPVATSSHSGPPQRMSYSANNNKSSNNPGLVSPGNQGGTVSSTGLPHSMNRQRSTDQPTPQQQQHLAQHMVYPSYILPMPGGGPAMLLNQMGPMIPFDQNTLANAANNHLMNGQFHPQQQFQQISIQPQNSQYMATAPPSSLPNQPMMHNPLLYRNSAPQNSHGGGVPDNAGLHLATSQAPMTLAYIPAPHQQNLGHMLPQANMGTSSQQPPPQQQQAHQLHPLQHPPSHQQSNPAVMMQQQGPYTPQHPGSQANFTSQQPPALMQQHIMVMANPNPNGPPPTPQQQQQQSHPTPPQQQQQSQPPQFNSPQGQPVYQEKR